MEVLLHVTGRRFDPPLMLSFTSPAALGSKEEGCRWPGSVLQPPAGLFHPKTTSPARGAGKRTLWSMMRHKEPRPDTPVAEDRERARPRAIVLADALVEDAAEEIVVLVHGGLLPAL